MAFSWGGFGTALANTGASALQGMAQRQQLEDAAREKEAARRTAQEQRDWERKRQLSQDAFLQKQFAAQQAQIEQQNQRANATQTREMSEGGFSQIDPAQIDPMAQTQVSDSATFRPIQSLLQSIGKQAKGSGGWAKTNYSQTEKTEANDLYTKAEDRKAKAAESNADRIARKEMNDSDNAALRAVANTRADASTSQPPRLRVVPAGTMKDYQGVNENLRELRELESIAETPEFSQALGLRNMLPEWAASRGLSSGALTVRGRLSNVASGLFLERSGAAVTPSEAKRLEGWTANLTDSPEKARNAIRNMRAFYETKLADMEQAYGEETGYHPLTPRRPTADAPVATHVYSPNNPFARRP